MAMDVLSVQAILVASESAFSTSGRVLSIRRTKLTPSSLEMCMCLKDHLDAQKRKQHISSLEGALDFEEEILTIEVQDNEATPLSDEEITLDAASQGTMASDEFAEHTYVKVAYHGFTLLSKDEKVATYGNTLVRDAFDEPDYALIDTFFLLVEAYLFAQLVDFKDNNPGKS
ncbi:zinc finger BED domain-containing protein RICESLEEPER 2 [Tanacetum coccineum]